MVACVYEFLFFFFRYCGEQISECVLFLTCELIEEKLVSIEIADILIEYHGIMCMLSNKLSSVDSGVFNEQQQQQKYAPNKENI